MQFCSDTTKPVGDTYWLIQHRRPSGVVRFNTDEGDVDRLLLDELLHVCQMQCAHLDSEFRHLAQMGNTQACGAHLLHVFRPRIDEGHVLSGLSHMRADVPAERTHAHNRYPWTHWFSPTECSTVPFAVRR
jgi:hypothetical protein